MDKVKFVFDTDVIGDVASDVVALRESYLKSVEHESDVRSLMRLHHNMLSRPRELDDDDLCVREGYRDVLSQFKELQMAGRVLAKARAEQYDPEGVEDVDPTTRMDYDMFDAVDDAKRVSERLRAQEAAAKEAAAKEAVPEVSAPEVPAPEVPAPEAPSSSAQ